MEVTIFSTTYVICRITILTYLGDKNKRKKICISSNDDISTYDSTHDEIIVDEEVNTELKLCLIEENEIIICKKCNACYYLKEIGLKKKPTNV